MEKSNFLHHFIQEPIYLINEELNQTSNEEVVTKSDEGPTNSTPTIEPELTTKEEPKPQITLKSKGANQKGVLILVEYNNTDIIAEEDEQFLLKILKAVHLTDSDVMIINMNGAQINSSDLPDHNTALSFGCSSPTIEYTISYQPQSNNGKTSLTCDTLHEISSDNAKKKKLWDALQSIFLSN